MQQIFMNSDPSDGIFYIEGDDFFHLSKVVRLTEGEKLRVSTASEKNFICEVTSCDKQRLECTVIEEVPTTELDNRIYLFCGIPKGDRMETIIEKCVELGVYEIIPVEMKNCVVKLDDKKKKSKLTRYQTIADTAAKQSKRSILPRIHEVMTYREALEYARQCDVNLVPYESKNGMADTKNAFDKIAPGSSISIIIGPEGGFDTSEITACEDMDIISLGSRILRTDTAAITATALVMSACELAAIK